MQSNFRFLFLLMLGVRLAGAAPTWQQTDASLALRDGDRIVWQLNFPKDEGKPYFHPLNLADGTTITALRPADHPWHRGLWWSWKYINHTNYWEEDKKTGKSAGLTDLVSVKAEPQANHSARVEMALNYHLPDKPPVMTEKRVLEVSAPDAKGNYYIDWLATFTAGNEDLVLDRTPPKNFSGGYAGLSCRMAKEIKGSIQTLLVHDSPVVRPGGIETKITGWTYTSSEGVTGSKENYGKQARWLDYSKAGGIAIFDHPSNLRHPTTWYPNEMPFFSPALLFAEPYTLAAGKMLTLRYRVVVHSETLDKDALEKQWQNFAKN